MRLKDRYGGLGIRILSNSHTVSHLETSLGANCKIIESDPEDENISPQQVAEHILNEVKQVPSSEFVIVHLDANRNGNANVGDRNSEELRKLHEAVSSPQTCSTLIELWF